jgi:hypothetical protein
MLKRVIGLDKYLYVQSCQSRHYRLCQAAERSNTLWRVVTGLPKAATNLTKILKNIVL